MEKLFPIGNKLGKTGISEYWLVKHSQKIGFEIRKYACVKPGSFVYGFDAISFGYLHTEIYFSI